jgi:hypothetical protein
LDVGGNKEEEVGGEIPPHHYSWPVVMSMPKRATEKKEPTEKYWAKRAKRK